jgi:tRNA nucleotidyltransferase (CCA-adding enzyme)
MFLDLDGHVYDYFDGKKHLEDRRVCFVGDAIERMTEDYLRILRYFRFLARYGDCDSPDEATCSSIVQCREGLHQISGERIWTELKKILCHSNSGKVMRLMLNRLELGPKMGMKDGTKSFDWFDKAFESQRSVEFKSIKSNYDAVSLFSALIKDEDELVSVIQRLRWSNAEKAVAGHIVQLRHLNSSVDDLVGQIAMAPNSERDQLKMCVCEYLRHIGNRPAYDRISSLTVPSFPVSGVQIAKRVKNAKTVGIVMKKMRKQWVESGFELTADELLQQLETFQSNQS